MIVDKNGMCALSEEDYSHHSCNTKHNKPVDDVVPVVYARLINANPYGNCSVCGFLIDIRDNFNFCPNCGKKIMK